MNFHRFVFLITQPNLILFIQKYKLHSFKSKIRRNFGQWNQNILQHPLLYVFFELNSTWKEFFILKDNFLRSLTVSSPKRYIFGWAYSHKKNLFGTKSGDPVSDVEMYCWGEVKLCYCYSQSWKENGKANANANM